MGAAVGTAFVATAAITFVGLPVYAWNRRGRAYAIFGLVVLLLSLPGALVTHARLTTWAAPTLVPWLHLLFLYGMLAAGLHLTALVTPRLRSTPFRIAVSIPGMTFVAAGALSGLWLLLLLPVRGLLWALGWDDLRMALRPLDVVPLAVAAVSIVTSWRPRREVVRVELPAHPPGPSPSDLAGHAAPDRPDEAAPTSLQRLRVERYRRRRPTPLPDRPLRIVQITDPHLGPWQPIHRLQRHLEGLLTHEPDLVLLTGDFLTMEGSGSRGALARALAPVARFAGRSFAIFGNHDHEAPDEVASALAENRITLLVDAEAHVDTAAGAVQLLGADYVGRGRREHLTTLLTRFPRHADRLRLLLLHDPRGFRDIPHGAVDLTLSGHTHGGQLGLVSFGIDWTILKRTPWPDHGLFGHGPNRLYVHRGTGFYGFPLRVGVPGEASILEVRRRRRVANG